MYDTKEECIAHGGHCWEGDGTSIQQSWTTIKYEWCKHCDARRKLTSRSPWTIEEL